NKGGKTSSGQLQSRQRSRAHREAIGFDAEPLEQREVEIAQRDAFPRLRRIGLVLTVLEAAAGEDDRQVGVDVRIPVADAAAMEDHRAVQERAAVRLFNRSQLVEEMGELLHLVQLDLHEQVDILLKLPMVRQRVIPLANAQVRRGEAAADLQ